MSGAVGLMASAAFGTLKPQWAPATGSAVECSSRPQKKATAHHMKTRPKKTQPWDVKRKGPTPYPPLPSLPPDWSFEPQQQQQQQPEAPASAPPL